jgi:23S rRNA pseudouridine2604 synthase
MRLNKYLGESGRWSRREADSLIEDGRVTINGVPAVLGTQVAPGDEVKVDGDPVGGARKLDRPVYIALNKPIGITSTTERHIEGNIIDFVDHEERIFPIGRLDKESEGLILLTNDGDIVNEVLRSEHNHEKEYVVAVDHPLDAEFAARMAAGIRLNPEGMTKRCKLTVLGPKLFSIILTQGLNRQIRRMCSALGYQVTALKRIRFMNIRLGDLPVGRWRSLTASELEGLLPKPAPKPQTKPARTSFGHKNKRR